MAEYGLAVDRSGRGLWYRSKLRRAHSPVAVWLEDVAGERGLDDLRPASAGAAEWSVARRDSLESARLPTMGHAVKLAARTEFHDRVPVRRDVAPGPARRRARPVNRDGCRGDAMGACPRPEVAAPGQHVSYPLAVAPKARAAMNRHAAGETMLGPDSQARQNCFMR